MTNHEAGQQAAGRDRPQRGAGQRDGHSQGRLLLCGHSALQGPHPGRPRETQGNGPEAELTARKTLIKKLQ